MARASEGGADRSIGAVEDHGAEGPGGAARASEGGADRSIGAVEDHGADRPGDASVGGGAGRGGDASVGSGARHGTAQNVTRGTTLAEDLEVAAGLWGKFKGLMGRGALASGAGLWLPDSNGIHMMFMRFPIDAVFVGGPAADGSRSVLSVHRALPTWRGLVPLVRGAKGVLELPVGTIDATETAVGDLVRVEDGR